MVRGGKGGVNLFIERVKKGLSQGVLIIFLSPVDYAGLDQASGSS